MKIIFIILLCQAILFHGYLSASLALVLSGGGVRSIYQMGVWKALIQLGVEIDGVFGSSAGAINAAAVASREYEAALRFWQELEVDTVFNISEKTSELLKKGFAEWKFLEALSLAERDVPEYIAPDGADKVTFVRVPTLDEVPYPVKMEPNLVVEFYSR